jgi:DNA-directed RNA polymerase
MPKLPPLKFRVGSSPSSAAADADGEGKGVTSMSSTIPQHRSQSKLPMMQPFLPPHNTVQPIPMSPERRPQSAHAASFSSPRAPFSPSKGANGFSPSREAPPKLPSLQQATHLPPNGRVSLNGGSFHSFQSQRPSSSHSAQSPTLLSPIQNRPSMSPTQGNHDVGPLAGFPPAPPSETPTTWTPYRQPQAPRRGSGHYASFSSIPGGHSSFVATPNASQSSPPQSSHGVLLSGLSPTKQSPRPVTSGSVTGAPILPPIQKLEPSPKLMGRSSPDAPIPPPVKCMTPEQEERRQRENALILQAQSHGSNGQHSVMSSPSLNRIPPLGPSALSQRFESSFESSFESQPDRKTEGQ